MANIVTALLSSKAQLTLPKRVRQLLGVHEKGDRIGFLIDEKSHRIFLAKVDLVPSEASYTNDEVRKLFKLRKEPGGTTFESAEAFLKHLHSL